jgi:hypothetical protein
MYVSVHHVIKDSQKWDQITSNMTTAVEQGKVPNGLKGLMYLPGIDGRKADCLWEANSVEALRSFLDREIGSAATNEYFQIDATQAFGLPQPAELRKAA